jgi:hypothetical protein
LPHDWTPPANFVLFFQCCNFLTDYIVHFLIMPTVSPLCPFVPFCWNIGSMRAGLYCFIYWYIASIPNIT